MNLINSFHCQTTELVNVIDGVQSRHFAMVIEHLIVPEVRKVTGSQERKICAVGLARLICDTPACFVGGHFVIFVVLCL
jgi:exportin-2 (importin alpha re-exporter)